LFPPKFFTGFIFSIQQRCDYIADVARELGRRIQSVRGSDLELEIRRLQSASPMPQLANLTHF
jgi:hypothetical protein